MTRRQPSTTVSENSETTPIYAQMIHLSIFQPAKTRDFLTGGNNFNATEKLKDLYKTFFPTGALEWEPDSDEDDFDCDDYDDEIRDERELTLMILRLLVLSKILRG